MPEINKRKGEKIASRRRESGSLLSRKKEAEKKCVRTEAAGANLKYPLAKKRERKIDSG